jgi:hypothetical protein
LFVCLLVGWQWAAKFALFENHKKWHFFEDGTLLLELWQHRLWIKGGKELSCVKETPARR